MSSISALLIDRSGRCVLGKGADEVGREGPPGRAGMAGVAATGGKGRRGAPGDSRRPASAAVSPPGRRGPAVAAVGGLVRGVMERIPAEDM